MPGSDFGTLLNHLRRDRGLSVRALGRAIGVTHAYLYQIESGESAAPRDVRLQALAEALEVPVDFLRLAADRLPEDVACTLRELFKTNRKALDEFRAAATV
jgi:transcriptional regulator with XRE-family HTH domain